MIRPCYLLLDAGGEVYFSSDGDYCIARWAHVNLHAFNYTNWATPSHLNMSWSNYSFYIYHKNRLRVISIWNLILVRLVFSLELSSIKNYYMWRGAVGYDKSALLKLAPHNYPSITAQLLAKIHMNEQYSQEEMLYKHICEIMDQHHPDSSQSSRLTAEII